MRQIQFDLQKETSAAIQIVIDGLLDDSGARGVFIVDRVGQLIGQAGRMGELDTTSLATLAAGAIAATGGLAQILGEEEFPTHFHQGERGSLHMTLVDDRGILIVIFDDKNALGLVRLRARRAGAELATVFEHSQKKQEAKGPDNRTAFADFTDEEIDNLFSD
ncbi:MAG TPA: roadblock/LC7 domain-containing protein [Myxococcales bacterium]|jgi:predicted regulator of Ras-like GTPase activity (Roadblock/LC7/MglB family)|nr:roadblock/LC7 domain-containing protein [Myxococcales bacterium]